MPSNNRRFIRVTTTRGHYSNKESTLIPAARVVDVTPIPPGVPAYDEGGRSIIRCAKDELYHVSETLEEVEKLLNPE